MIPATAALALAAASGLGSLLPRRQLWAAALAAALLLAEAWPTPFPQERPPTVPAFYQRLAAEPGRFAVLDLPAVPAGSGPEGYQWLAPTYQYFQTTHGKAIASGFLARGYIRHPVIPELTSGELVSEPMAPLRVDGRPAGYADLEGWLAAVGYRYLVRHLALPVDAPTNAVTERVVARTLGERVPIYADAEVQVFDLRLADRTLARLGDGWYEAEQGARWAAERAELIVVAPRPGRVTLTLTPAAVYALEAGGGGQSGRLEVSAAGVVLRSLPVRVGEPATIELELTAGVSSVWLRLEAGSFRPSDSGASDTRLLSFAVSALDLRSAVGQGQPREGTGTQ